MLTLLRQAKVRTYRMENLLLLETLVFLCIPPGRVKDIMRLIRLGASPAGSLNSLSPRILHRLEEALLDSLPGALGVQARIQGPCLELDLAWPDLLAKLCITPREGRLRVDLAISGHGQEVMEMARDAMVL
ncbi:MAG: hypothetical protein HY794_02495 [Desulfarculus sp.]|nr:hypothetical protein [Desulfarculus sp.]